MTKYEETLDRLNQQSLVDIMDGMNYKREEGKSSTRAYYLCPFHDDHNPSFSVSLTPPDGYKYNAFLCHTCKKAGQGAVMLMQELLKLDGLSHEHLQSDAMHRVAKICHITDIDWNWESDQHHEEFTDPEYSDLNDRYSRHYSSIRCEHFLPVHLHGLGLDATSQCMSIEELTQFSMAEIEDILNNEFGCYPLQSARYSDNEGRLHHVWTTDDYAILEFDHSLSPLERSDKGFMLRKYEPMFHKKSGSSYKNTFFYDSSTVTVPSASPAGISSSSSSSPLGGTGGGLSSSSLSSVPSPIGGTGGGLSSSSSSPIGGTGGGLLHGNATLLSLLESSLTSDRNHFPDLGKMVSHRRSLTTAKRPLPDPESGKIRQQSVQVLKSVVICAGQKDAINVYLHSDAHVVYPHSETSLNGLSRRVIDTLLWIADRVYVCFDADEAGQRAQNALCLRHLELRPISLPRDLSTLRNAINGKRCKDITEFVSVYCPKFNLIPRFLIRQMMLQAKSLKFWEREVHKQRTEEQGEYNYRSKFTFDGKSLCRFLDANGFRGIWSKNANGLETVIGYMHIGPYHSPDITINEQQVKIIQLEDGKDYAIRLIQNFLLTYNLTEDEAEYLENALVNQRKVGDDAISLFVSHTILDINYWLPNENRDVEPGVYYIFCRNKAMRISADSISLVNYSRLPFMVNAAAVNDIMVSDMNENLRSQMPVFRPNPEYESALKSYEAKMNLQTCSPEERKQMTMQLSEYRRLWHHLRVSNDYRNTDRFPIFQIEEGTTRLYWQDEEDGYILSPDQRQMHDMMLFNRMNNIGYLLIPKRTKAFVQYVVFVDYKALSRDASSGGTGKSTILDLLNIITPVYNIKGNTMKFGTEFARNFDGFMAGYHSIIAFDETHERFKWTDMKGLENGVDIKQLYRDTVRIDFHQSPKMVFSTNFAQFNLKDDSTFRRVAICPVSDYFHPASSDGTRRERTYKSIWGRDDIIKEATPDELNAIAWYFAHCIQLFLQTNTIYEIPTDAQMVSRFASANITDGEFLAWAKEWFQVECHFCRPIAITEMQLSFARWVNGTELRTDRVRAGRKQFMDMVNDYIYHAGITLLGMDNAAIRGRSAGTTKYPDRNCWVTQEINGVYHPEMPRIVQQSDCCYFYRKNDPIPKRSTDVPKCGDNDPEFTSTSIPNNSRP